MSDMLPGVVVDDLDIRVLIVLTVGIVVGSNETAGVTAGIVGLGLFWAFLTSREAQPLVNDAVGATESRLAPLTQRRSWQLYGRPIAYTLFVIAITLLAVY